MTTAVFAGSFDPFHKGHQDVVRQAQRVFSDVVILLASNPEKEYQFSLDERRRIVRASFEKNLPPVFVLPEGEFTGEWVRDTFYGGAITLIRGIRDGEDLKQEKKLARFNRARFDLPTAYFATYYDVSSTGIREALALSELLVVHEFAANDDAAKIMLEKY